MSYFRKYIAYLKDNPENYWFKRKLYGWGWTPAKWQGWLVILLFVLFIAWLVSDSASEPFFSGDDIFVFSWKVFVAVGVLIFICYKTGEKPKWQWGLPDKNKE